MDRLLNQLAEWLVRHRAVVTALLGLVTLAAAIGLTRLEIDDVPRSIFRSEDQEFAQLEQLFQDFGGDDNDCLVVLQGLDFLSPAGARLLRRIDRGLSGIEGVEGVDSLADILHFAPLPVPLLPAESAAPEVFEQARALAQRHPLVRGHLLSLDDRTTVLVARLRGENLPISELAPRVLAMRSLLREELREERSSGAAQGHELRARVTGVPPLRVEIFDTIAREQRLFTALGAALGVLIGLIMFRRFAPMLVASSASALAGLIALGGMGLAGEGVNLMNSSLPMLVMVIALTDGMHLLFDILASRRRGVAIEAATQTAVRHLTVPCALTSLTTAVGFASLGISRIDVISRFGLAFALAVALTFLIVLSAVPLLSSFLLAGDAACRLPRGASLHLPVERAIRWITRHARAVSVAGIFLTLGLLAIALRLVPDNRLTEATPDGSEAVQALNDLERSFGGALPGLVLCEWPAGVGLESPQLASFLGEITALLEAQPYTHSPLSALDLAELLPGHAGLVEVDRLPLELKGRFLRSDLRRALVSALVPDSTAMEAEQAQRELETGLREILLRYPGYSASLTGTSFVARRNINLIITDFVVGLAMAAGVILTVLTLALRSWRLGLVAILPNAFPLVLAAASLVVMGLELQVASAIAFTVCLGIAVDDTIHFLARYRRERAEGWPIEEAVVRAMLAVGSALVVTTMVLLAGFGVIGLSSIPTSRLFAWLCTLGLLGALLGDLVLLPALVVAFDERDPAPED